MPGRGTPVRAYEFDGADAAEELDAGSGGFAGSDDSTQQIPAVTLDEAEERPQPKSRAMPSDEAQPAMGRRAAGAAPPLLRVGGRPPLGLYLAQLLQRWPFTLAQAKAQARTANRGLILGNLWLVIHPLLEALAFFLIFAVILQANQGIDNYIGFLLIGVFLFQYTARALNQSAGIIRANKPLIRAFAFPRASLVLALTVRNLLNTIPAIAVLLALLLVKPEPAVPTTLWLLFPAVLGLQTILNLGLALIVARLTDITPDVKHLVSFLTRMLLFTSCVMFAADRIRALPGGDAFLTVNPIFQTLDISRDLLLYQTYPDPQSWLVLAAWALGVLGFGFVYFWRGEVNYGRA